MKFFYKLSSLEQTMFFFAVVNYMSKLEEQITSHYDIQRRYEKVSILLSALASTRTQSTKQKITLCRYTTTILR